MIPVAPKTPKELLVEAYLRGAAWRGEAEYQNLLNLDMGRVLTMQGTEPDAKLLLRSRQLSDSNYDVLVASYLKRLPDYDGEAGPATYALATLPRCPIPDFAPPPTASFDYGIPDLNDAVRSYQKYAESGYLGGSGSWPKCDPQFPQWHSVRVCLNDSNASTHQKSILKDVLRYVEETEAEVGQHVRHILNGDPKQAEHDVRFQYIAGGVIGFAYFPDPDRCNQTVVARIDNSFNARLPVLAELLTHEYKGHSDGLQHTRGGIMNPSIGSPTNRPTWKGDPSFSRKKKFFGGEPLPSTPTPTTPPPTPGPVPTPTPGLKIPIMIIDGDGKKYGIHPWTES